jgi:hypothetical protein
MRPELPLVEPEVEPDVLMVPEPEVELMLPEPEVLLIEPEPEVLPIEPELEVVEPEVLPEVVLPLVEPMVEPDVLPEVVPVVVWANAVPEVRARPQTKATAWSGSKMCFFIMRGERGKEELN